MRPKGRVSIEEGYLLGAQALLMHAYITSLTERGGGWGEDGIRRGRGECSDECGGSDLVGVALSS